ncbi:hypothetical protein JCM5350_003126 [Sporobolomyces pararoseus]
MADILFYLLAYAGEKAHHKISEKRSPLIPVPPPPATRSESTIGGGQDLAPVYTREPLPIPRLSSPPSSSNDPSNSSPHRLSRSSSSVPPPTAIRPAARPRSQSHSPRPPPPLTEHRLRELALAWKLRYQSLFLRLATLLDAMRRGLRNSWAGKVTWEKCDEVRLAIIEAEFIMNRLAKAVEWCDGKGLQKLPLVALVKGSRRSSVSRPTHSSCPPSLVHLPSPLPEAPPAISTRLTVALPPWVFSPQARPLEDDSEAPQAVERPPEYTRHYDPFKGERVIERARWEDERVPDGADQVVLIR